MPYESFLASVRSTGEYATAEEAEQVTQCVFSALGMRLPAEAVGHLADQVPEPLGETLNDQPAAPLEWGVHEFVTHVAQETGVDETVAAARTRGVLSTLAGTISGGELNKLLSRLPSGYAELFGHPELAD